MMTVVLCDAGPQGAPWGWECCSVVLPLLGWLTADGALPTPGRPTAHGEADSAFRSGQSERRGTK